MKGGKRFFYSIIEEMVLNPEYYGYAGGRIEVWDTKADSLYPEEYRFLIPVELMGGFREWLDGASSVKPVYIKMETPVITNKIKKRRNK